MHRHFGSETDLGTERLQARLRTSDRKVRGRKAARAASAAPAEGQDVKRASASIRRARERNKDKQNA